jgi:signal transduction histidine kinase
VRRTIRFRLTVLYGGLFLVAGAGLLAITYLLVLQSTGDYLFLNRTTNRDLGLFTHFPGPPAGQGLLARDLTHVRYIRAPTAATLAQARAQINRLLAQANQQHAAELHQLLVMSGVALAIMAVVAIGLGWLVAGRVLHPLRTISTAVQTISARNLHARLALDGPDDELKELGTTFDGLLGRLEAAFEAQRRFVANASHELRTPLTRQRTLLEVALGDPEATVESLQATYGRVLAAVEQQERLIEALLTLARSERGLERREPLDLAAVAGEVLLARRLEAQRCGLHMAVALGAAPTAGDPRLVERLMTNLVDNAMRHNVAAGWLAVSTETGDGQARLCVANSGPVVPPAAVERLFQPFQRLGAERTAPRDGLGLGLSIVQAIATAHGATLAAEAPPGGGLAIEVRFPAAAADADGHAASSAGDRTSPATHEWLAPAPMDEQTSRTPSPPSSLRSTPR